MHQIPQLFSISIGFVRSWTTTSFDIFQVLATLFVSFILLRNTLLFHGFAHISLGEISQMSRCILS
jgi:hypothetical protein